MAVFPYLTAGFPAPEACPELVAAMLRAGADGLEIGIPFSDPVADGLTLQRANEQALRAGATLETALGLARAARAASAIAPIVFMSYYNPILAYGEPAFCQAAAAAGADGLIVPDLPPEECAPLRAACLQAGLDYILMVAPTSTPERTRRIASLAGGFIYCVALVGVTGARGALSTGLGPFLARVREATPVPLLVGFGISRPEHVRALRGQADGVVVASALADLIETTPPAERAEAVSQRVRALKLAGAGLEVGGGGGLEVGG
ncbi:MAG: tryptophan synthase subunit alpha [Chloroflexi bacterium]|nr:tryptophan synthase subunit alpha [Chloroflexota bacterium]